MVRNIDSGQNVVQIDAPQQITQRTTPNIERAIDDTLIRKPDTIDLHLAAVQIIDSFGLNWLLQIQARLEEAGIRFRLANPPAVVTDILLATRLDMRFGVVQLNGQGEVNRA